MPSPSDVAALHPGDWSIGSKDHGTIKEFQDLGEQLGINLKRDTHKAVSGKHCATEFGFGILFDSVKPVVNIVSDHRGDTIKFSAGPKKFTATVDQISIHRAGAHARIVVSNIKG